MIKGHHKYKHGRKTAPKIGTYSRFSRIFDEISVYSRPGILIIKLLYFPGCVRTLTSDKKKKQLMFVIMRT